MDHCVWRFLLKGNVCAPLYSSLLLSSIFVSLSLRENKKHIYFSTFSSWQDVAHIHPAGEGETDRERTKDHAVKTNRRENKQQTTGVIKGRMNSSVPSLIQTSSSFWAISRPLSSFLPSSPCLYSRTSPRHLNNSIHAAKLKTAALIQYNTVVSSSGNKLHGNRDNFCSCDSLPAAATDPTSIP